MPYILSDQKAALEILRIPESPGQLNYLFTELIKLYLRTKGESYQSYNDVIGALECCKIELYRRRIADYEDKKILENGDVY